MCALRFFCGVTLGWSDAFERIVAAREPQKLPVVLSADEIVRFLQAVPGLRNRAALTTAYGASLHVGEVARLTTGAIDSWRMLIRVEHGKGGKDRYVMLSPQLLQILRAYWRLARPGHWLFPGRETGEPVSVATRSLPRGRAACRAQQAGDSTPPCGTASLPTCKPALTSVSFRSYWAMPGCRPPPAICKSQPPGSPTRRARSIASP